MSDDAGSNAAARSVVPLPYNRQRLGHPAQLAGWAKGNVYLRRHLSQFNHVPNIYTDAPFY